MRNRLTPLPRLAVGTTIALAILAGCSSSPETVASDSTASTASDTAASETTTSETTASDTAASDTAATETTASEEAASSESTEAGANGPVDITGAVLESTDPHCDSYVGEYSSTVLDVNTGTEFVGELAITAGEDTCTLSSNQIPNHDIGIDAEFPGQVDAIAGRFEITASPQVNSEPTRLDFTVNAIMLNGVIWEAYPAACFDEGREPLGREAIGCGGNLLDHPWRYNVGSPLNAFRLDTFSAHIQPDGLYHYHATPKALYDLECAVSTESPVIGFARDGFPIFGPCFTDADGVTRATQSSYQLKSGVREDIDGFTTPTAVGNVESDDYNGQFIGDYEFVEGSGDLDACNGMTVGDQYGYHLTGEYPYVIGCYSGTPSNEFGPTN